MSHAHAGEQQDDRSPPSYRSILASQYVFNELLEQISTGDDELHAAIFESMGFEMEKGFTR
jgi:hypothetical protein